MKWLLVVAIFGSVPLETDMVFDTLQQCLDAEDAMRAEYSRSFNEWVQRAKVDPDRYNYPNSEKFAQRRFGLENVATCIPHAKPAT